MNTTTHSDSPDKTTDHQHCTCGPHGHGPDDPSYSELTRINAGLFVGVLALMTFLLTVGYQHPHKYFSWALYSAITLLGINLILHVIGLTLKMRFRTKQWAVKTSDAESKDLEKIKKDAMNARKQLKIFRVVQQILFVLAVVAVVAMALSAANFFFSLPASSSAAPQ